MARTDTIVKDASVNVDAAAQAASDKARADDVKAAALVAQNVARTVLKSSKGMTRGERVTVAAHSAIKAIGKVTPTAPGQSPKMRDRAITRAEQLVKDIPSVVAELERIHAAALGCLDIEARMPGSGIETSRYAASILGLADSATGILEDVAGGNISAD